MGERMEPAALAGAASSLRSALGDIESCDLACHPATRHRLEGAVLVLEQLAKVPAPCPSDDRL